MLRLIAIGLAVLALLVHLAIPYMAVLAQIPPTPTPLPPGSAHFNLPSEFSLWAGTSSAIQVWNWIGDGQIIVQGLAIIGLVLAGIFIVYKFIRSMSAKDAQE